MEYYRGQVVLVELVESKGSVQQGDCRACVVVQNNTGNKYAPTTIIAPLTSRMTKAKLPTHVEIKSTKYNSLRYDSILLCEQPMTIDESQIIRIVGEIEGKYVNEMNTALAVSLGLL